MHSPLGAPPIPCGISNTSQMIALASSGISRSPPCGVSRLSRIVTLASLRSVYLLSNGLTAGIEEDVNRDLAGRLLVRQREDFGTGVLREDVGPQLSQEVIHRLRDINALFEARCLAADE